MLGGRRDDRGWRHYNNVLNSTMPCVVTLLLIYACQLAIINAVGLFQNLTVTLKDLPWWALQTQAWMIMPVWHGLRFWRVYLAVTPNLAAEKTDLKLTAGDGVATTNDSGVIEQAKLGKGTRRRRRRALARFAAATGGRHYYQPVWRRIDILVGIENWRRSRYSGIIILVVDDNEPYGVKTWPVAVRQPAPKLLYLLAVTAEQYWLEDVTTRQSHEGMRNLPLETGVTGTNQTCHTMANKWGNKAEQTEPWRAANSQAARRNAMEGVATTLWKGGIPDQAWTGILQTRHGNSFMLSQAY